MKKPKIIAIPELEHARPLKPLELNVIKCDVKHTVITPSMLKNPPNNR